MRILVSACLLGIDCRYDGGSCLNERVTDLLREHELIPACPEQLGGLPAPRPPVERANGRAIDASGADFTREFTKGADDAAKLAALFHCRCAVLKSNSPSCGCGCIYDGSFSGHRIPGNGITAERLLHEGIQVLTESDLEAGAWFPPTETSTLGAAR